MDNLSHTPPIVQISSGRRAYTSGEILERWMDPKFLFFVNRKGSRAEFLRQERRMQGQYLGACLDYARHGAMNACFWGLGGARGLIEFIEEWMKLNKGNLMWSDEPMPPTLELPRISYDKCPRDKSHSGTVVDLGGRVRCSHVSRTEAKPSFLHQWDTLDSFSMSHRSFYQEMGPAEPCFDDDDYDADGNLDRDKQRELEIAEADMERFDAEEPISIDDPCYALISEPRTTIMPLERVLKRLNIHPEREGFYCRNELNCKIVDTAVCLGHERPNKFVGYPFEGWTLAWYVQKWHEQSPDGKAPVLMKPGEIDAFRKWPDFRVYSSDD